MCKLLPDGSGGFYLFCLQEHHQPVILEIWDCTPPVPSPDGIGRLVPPMDLMVATLTDLDNARVVASKTRSPHGTIAIARDWFTGEEHWLKTPKKRH
jgi:hypothetical protein